MYHKRPDLPEITLSALAETGRLESSISVLNQRSYTGKKPVISSALANTRCADLGIDGLLEKLNATLGTSYSLGSKILRFFGIAKPDGLHSILEPFIERNDDFGTAYAHLRPYWYDYDVATIKQKLRAGEEEDAPMRRKVLVDGRITERDVPPRRVWDLYANRVVPYWLARRYSWAISHAWVDEKERVNVMTPFNGYEWPVPMPNDGNLDLVRIEMLNARHRAAPDFGAGYAWLDILCLRQYSGRGEHLRLEEWKLDVPIGVTGGCTSRRNQPALNPLFTVPVAFLFFTVYHHVDILGLNELLFSFPPVLELQQSPPSDPFINNGRWCATSTGWVAHCV